MIPLADQIAAVSRMLPAGSYIAGGCLLAERIGVDAVDIDVFVDSDETQAEVIAALARQGYSVAEGRWTRLAKEGARYVDIPSVRIKTPEEFIRWVDFTICQFAFKDGVLLEGETAVADVDNRVLRLNPHSASHRLIQPRRIEKYIARGFVPDETVSALAEQYRQGSN